jgi:hypothetical protein
MATATAKSPAKNQRCELLEYSLLELSSAGKVDVDKGIIYGAKIVGLQSRNLGRTIGLDPAKFNGAVDEPYSYSKTGLQSAIPMYEGAAIRIKHPKSKLTPDGRRVSLEATSDIPLAGELRNVVMREDGLYGDIHLLKSHPLAALILETAQRMPGKIALSHNADGVPVLKNGRAVIEEILAVKSVDIIDDKPGTTNGLFESHQETETVKRTIKQIVGSVPAGTKGRKLLEAMCDQSTIGAPGKIAEMEMDGPVDAAPESQISDALRAVFMSVIDDDSLDSAGKLAKLKELFKMKDKIDGVTAPDAAATPEDDMGGDDDSAETEESLIGKIADPAAKKLLEKFKAESDSLKAKDHARALLESAKREVTPVRLSAVTKCASDTERKQLIETWAVFEPAPARVVRRPDRSAPLVESAAGGASTETSEQFIKSLKD